MVQTCPKCKGELKYLSKKDRWYCKNCKKKFKPKGDRNKITRDYTKAEAVTKVADRKDFHSIKP